MVPRQLAELRQSRVARRVAWHGDVLRRVRPGDEPAPDRRGRARDRAARPRDDGRARGRGPVALVARTPRIPGVKVGVVGLGTMGAGIAQIAVAAGHDTVGREVSMDLAERGRSTIEHFLGRAVEKGKLDAADRDAALGRLTLTTELSDLADCDLVIEAALEELDLKREVFAEPHRITPPKAAVPTNTSALSGSENPEATPQPQRGLGGHLFNPAPLLAL